MHPAKLIRALERVPDFPQPDAASEQYRTPAKVAAELLAEANADGCIAGKRVLDLGCGTGVLSLAAQLLGATVHGVDQDAVAVELARGAVPGATFEVAEMADWSPPDADTVIMNPPFGAQRKHADRAFYERAIQSGASTIWFLQQPRNERFLTAWFRDKGRPIERVALWDYPLDARFAFHDEVVAGIQVGGYRAG